MRVCRHSIEIDVLLQIFTDEDNWDRVRVVSIEGWMKSQWEFHSIFVLAVTGIRDQQQQSLDAGAAGAAVATTEYQPSASG